MYLTNCPFQIPGTLDIPAGAVMGPSVPSPTARRERREDPARSRGRARGIRDESGRSEPILDDDDDKTSEDEEAASPQLESSEDGESDVGLDSESEGNAEVSSVASSDLGAFDNGVDGDSFESMLRKRTKRASRLRWMALI
ncbi:RNA-binding protein with serine-rich domain 1-like [Camellia sinensis]|uniref:RNA-binding protein with serine-rich domain 1-like n=1 Tax=Camellia sinensis TaxID=4442 RepID=UPI001035E47A|nr:RNA-binding protein with serine-rich domain 1-like [Camellia sinensis]